ncbi:germinal-center associated nuclear protein [Leptopilina boulardi]|uniref:germinal-center associated nuclear protein n=1 Tax=Leptopilina boulardi TaxID=63433 RepID=UPI0021F54C92|nr:germinal-center associated nuclear protein [Leptopilina boulardi]
MSITRNGTCMAMCPKSERLMREEKRLLHIFERKEEKADPTKTVKCFNRPAAGRTMTDLSELRPKPVLIMTMNYLFTKIATRADYNWSFIYDFIFDRLRAIRQDLVIQRINPLDTIEILEPIVRFHVYAAQRLCTHSISTFDPKINNQHLLECLKHLLVCYDECSNVTLNDFNINESLRNLNLNDNRTQMEAIYILVNLGEINSLTRGLNLPIKYKESREVKQAMEISFSAYLNNYVRTCRLISTLSPLLKCAALCNLRKIRRVALEIMSVGYNSRTLSFPEEKLQEILLYRDIDQIRIDSRFFGFMYTNGNIFFEKEKFQNTDKIANPEMLFNEKELHKLLPDILLD